jgi:hypothetical protein
MQSLFWGTKLPSLKTHLIEALSLLLSSATATATAFLSSYLINPQTEFWHFEEEMDFLRVVVFECEWFVHATYILVWSWSWIVGCLFGSNFACNDIGSSLGSGNDVVVVYWGTELVREGDKRWDSDSSLHMMVACEMSGFEEVVVLFCSREEEESWWKMGNVCFLCYWLPFVSFYCPSMPIDWLGKIK